MSGPTRIDLEPPKPAPAKPAEPPKANQVMPAPRRPLPTTSQFLAIALTILGAAIAAALVLVAVPEEFRKGPGGIVILLVGGLIALTLLLYLGTIIHRTVGVGTRTSAFGMPDGSIRALIALSLVLIFAIIGVTVLSTGTGTGEKTESKGITSAQIDDLENVQIVSISVVDPAASPGTERYDVTAIPELSQSGHDFGLQLLTTVSTLVVAVAGFYFGSRAVAQGSKAALAAIAPPPTAQDGGAAGGGGDGGDTGTDNGEGTDGEAEELAEGDVIGAVEDAAADEDDGADGAGTGAGGAGADAGGGAGAGGAGAGDAAAAGAAGAGAAGAAAGAGGAAAAGAGGAAAEGGATGGGTVTGKSGAKKDKP